MRLMLSAETAVERYPLETVRDGADLRRAEKSSTIELDRDFSTDVHPHRPVVAMATAVHRAPPQGEGDRSR